MVAVSHGIFIRFFLLDSLLGDAFSPRHAERLWHLRTINCGISVFTLGERGRAVDPELGDWACLSWMIPPAGASRSGSSGERCDGSLTSAPGGGATGPSSSGSPVSRIHCSSSARISSSTGRALSSPERSQASFGSKSSS